MPERLRVGVIGCGLIAQVMHLHYLRELADRFEIAALCDVSEELTCACAGDYGVTVTYYPSGPLIEYNPILSGQTSPFEVMARHNPAMHNARLEFKTLMGGTIEWRDAPPKPMMRGAASNRAPTESAAKGAPASMRQARRRCI